MKSMTCRQLGGACDIEFKANTFDEMASQSRQHGMEMMEKGVQDNLKAMQEMRDMMMNPEAMQKWMAEKESLFNSL